MEYQRTLFILVIKYRVVDALLENDNFDSSCSKLIAMNL